MASQSPQPNPTPIQEIGFSISVRSFLVQAEGFPTAKINDLIETEEGSRGWINALHQDRVQILMLDEGQVEPKSMLKKSQSSLTLPVGDFLLGRSISPIATPIDGKGPLLDPKQNLKPEFLPIELDIVAPGIDKRQFIDSQFETGVTLIDTLIPLGHGQRELIIGDARSGKTRFLIDLVANQKGKNVVVIYTLIGKPTTSVRNITNILGTIGAGSYTIIVGASSNDPPPLSFLAPHTALTIAEYFQRQGKDVLVILDDMANHAKMHREISLLSERFPGREAYPGDIFYQHAHLMERAGKFSNANGGGSITLLPVIEINLNDFTTFIPNNLMSMTDGHLLFKSELASVGQFPAIDISLSVSRVGRQTQNRIQNSIAYKLRQILNQAEEYETLSRFSAELPESTQVVLRQKDLINIMIRQTPLTNIPRELQTVFMALVLTNFFKFREVNFVIKNSANLLMAFTKDPALLEVTNNAFKYKSDNDLIAKLESLQTKILSVCQ